MKHVEPLPDRVNRANGTNGANGANGANGVDRDNGDNGDNGDNRDDGDNEDDILIPFYWLHLDSIGTTEMGYHQDGVKNTTLMGHHQDDVNNTTSVVLAPPRWYWHYRNGINVISMGYH